MRTLELLLGSAGLGFLATVIAYVAISWYDGHRAPDPDKETRKAHTRFSEGLAVKIGIAVAILAALYKLFLD